MGFFTYVGIGLAVLLVVFIVYVIIVRTANSRRYNKRFAKTLKSINEYNEKINYTEPEEVKPVVEESYVQQPEQENLTQQEDKNAKAESERYAQMIKRIEERRRRFEERRRQEEEEQDLEVEPKDDFEDFMDKHSYSRLFADKTLYEQIKDLSPELKAIIFSGLFKRIDDDK